MVKRNRSIYESNFLCQLPWCHVNVSWVGSRFLHNDLNSDNPDALRSPLHVQLTLACPCAHVMSTKCHIKSGVLAARWSPSFLAQWESGFKAIFSRTLYQKILKQVQVLSRQISNIRENQCHCVHVKYDVCTLLYWKFCEFMGLESSNISTKCSVMGHLNWALEVFCHG